MAFGSDFPLSSDAPKNARSRGRILSQRPKNDDVLYGGSKSACLSPVAIIALIRYLSLQFHHRPATVELVDVEQEAVVVGIVLLRKDVEFPQERPRKLVSLEKTLALRLRQAHNLAERKRRDLLELECELLG